MKALATKPGFLTEEYIKGRRMSYVNPIRMYLFVSAIFFLIYMSFFSPENTSILKLEPGETQDSLKSAKIHQQLDKANTAFRNVDSLIAESAGEEQNTDSLKTSSGRKFTINNTRLPKTVHDYDSVQESLPKKERHGFIQRYFIRKLIMSSQYSNEHPEEMKQRWTANFYHALPYMLFISLPLIALLLKLLYIRRKDYYYVAHAIFIVHYYIFFFLSLLLIFTIKRLGNVGEIIAAIMEIGLFVYLYIAMMRFYKQGWFKTLIKFILLLFIGMGTIVLLAGIVGVNAFLNVASAH